VQAYYPMMPEIAEARCCLSVMRPVVDIYSTFLQRSFDQIFQEVALQNLPVLFCMPR